MICLLIFTTVHCTINDGGLCLVYFQIYHSSLSLTVFIFGIYDCLSICALHLDLCISELQLKFKLWQKLRAFSRLPQTFLFVRFQSVIDTYTKPDS